MDVWWADFSPVDAGLTFMRSPAGDFDGDDLLQLSDVESLSADIRDPPPYEWLQGMFNLNGDTTSDGREIVGLEDLRIWVKDLRHTWFGDANLDGQFNSLDLVSLLQAGQYQDTLLGNSTWGTGDWNADGEFDRGDLLVALQDGGYGQGPRAALRAVPEPSAVALVLAGLLGLALSRLVGGCRVFPDSWRA